MNYDANNRSMYEMEGEEACYTVNKEEVDAQEFCESGDNCSEENANIILETTVHNEKEAYEVYCSYAHHVGFSVRKEHGTFWPNSRNIKTKDFVCSKAGFKKELKITETVNYKKGDTRCGCPAMIRYAVDEEGNWMIKKFIESHNHSFANPGDRHLLRSSRKISEVNADVLRSMTLSGIRPKDAFNFLAKEVGGLENLECTKKDAFNFIQKDRRCRIENGDANALLQLFTDRRAEDSMFEWDFQVDDSGRLMSFFWSDGTSRLDYDCFGDVIIFDTSYRLNKYNLCCAPIVGVNHNWQNVLFGVGFLSEETVDSFKWLFKCFMRIMGNNHPITIYTDQDQAMARAIAESLPNTRHRLCQWHIHKKLSTKVHCGVVNKIVNDLFYKCMSKCEFEEEFDETWQLMIETGNLHENAWLADMYRIRHKWSTVFNKDVFGMGILSTQRSESTNNICHGASKPTSSITDCFLGIENVMRTWRRNEKDEDFRRHQSVIIPATRSSPILRQAASFYSKKLYTLFEEDFLYGSCGLQIHPSLDNSTEFYIENLDDHRRNRTWVVNFDHLSLDIQCSCKKFEMMGLLCAHSIRVLNFLHITKIAEKYLLLRWSADAKKNVYNSYQNKHLHQPRECNVVRTDLLFQTHMQKISYQITNKARGNPEAEQYMEDSMKKLSLNIDDILGGNLSKERKQPKKKKEKVGNDSNLHDPAKMRPKGVSNARLKGFWERKKRPKVKHIEVKTAAEPEALPSQPSICSLPDFLTQDFFIPRNRESYTSMMTDSIDELILPQRSTF